MPLRTGGSAPHGLHFFLLLLIFLILIIFLLLLPLVALHHTELVAMLVPVVPRRSLAFGRKGSSATAVQSELKPRVFTDLLPHDAVHLRATRERDVN